MRSYIVNENHIGSVLSKIFRYTKTDTQPVTFVTFCENATMMAHKNDIFKVVIRKNL